MQALPEDHPAHRLSDLPYLVAARGGRPAHIPVWFQRQAGRHLPEYHEVRGTGSILEATHDPERAVEITLQPVRRYGVDAAVLYSDIVAPLATIGAGVDIEPGVGPVTTPPFCTVADLDRIRPMDVEADYGHVTETVRRLAAELEVPLIGFAGAPFTLASYLIEGGPSRDHLLTKRLMRSDRALWDGLCERLADLAVTSLRAQVLAGASAVQLFDTWAGALDPVTYEAFAAPWSRRILESVADLGVPRVHFGVGTGELLAAMAVGADMVGVDWRVPLDVARQRVGPDVAVQGNLDPAVLVTDPATAVAATAEVLLRNGGRPGHVFNLGHGVPKEADPEIVAAVVRAVQAADPTTGLVPEGTPAA